MKTRFCGFTIALILLCGTFNSSSAQLLTWFNFATHSTGSNVNVREITGDTLGNTYSLIQFSDILYLDNLSFNAQSNLDFVIAKRDANDVLQWCRRITGVGNFSCRSICADGDGNVYVAGSYNGYDTIRFDSAATGTLTLPVKTEVAGYIGKYDMNGVLQWVKTIDGQFSSTWQVSIDLNMIRLNGHSLFVAGLIDGVYDYDPSGMFSAVGVNGGMGCTTISSFDLDGNLNWATLFGSYNNYLNYFCFTQNQDILIAGDLTTSADLDPGPANASFNPVGPSDIFITRLDSSGTYQWTRRIIGNDEQEIAGFTLMGDTNFLICGITDATLDLDPTSGVCTITCPSGTRKFFARYNMASTFVSGLEVNCGILPEQLYFNGNSEIIIYGGNSFAGYYALALFDTAYNYINYETYGGSSPGCSAGTTFFRYPFTLYVGGHCEGLNNYGYDGSINVYATTDYLTGFVAKYYLGWGPEAISEHPETASMRAFPNPTSGNCRVALNLPAGTNATLSIFDLSGKLVWQDTRVKSEGRDATSLLDLRGLPNGLYLLVCESVMQTQTTRIIITQ